MRAFAIQISSLPLRIFIPLLLLFTQFSLAAPQSLSISSLDNDEQLRAYFEQHGVPNSAAQIRQFAEKNLASDASQSAARGLRILERMLSAMHESARPTDARARWAQLMQEMQAARELEAIVHKYIPLEYSLRWLEELHRFVESDLRTAPGEARQFLAERASNLDAIWLRVRLDRILSREHNPELQSIASSAKVLGAPILDQILRARIAAYIATNSETQRSAVDNFCALLEQQGLKRTLRLEAENTVNWEKELHERPGCLVVEQAISETSNDRIVQIISDNDLLMSFDSVVKANGINFSVNARSFDGSFFDLSATESSGGSLTIDVRHGEYSLLPAFMSAAASHTEEEDAKSSGLLSYLVNGELISL